MNYSRREFFKFGLGFVGGALSSEAFRVLDKENQYLSSIEALTSLSIKKFEIFRDMGILKDYLMLPESYYDWNKASSILATDPDGQIEMIIPSKPKVKEVGVIKVEGGVNLNQSQHFEKVRLVSLKGEYDDVSKSGKIESPTLISKNTEVFNTLSNLPVGHPYFIGRLPVGFSFENVPFWNDSNYPKMSGDRVESLRLGVDIYNTTGLLFRRFIDNMTEVGNQDVIEDKISRKLGRWTDSVVSLPVVDRADKVFSEDYFVAKISSISISKKSILKGHKFYIL